jgi:hypothetical protein
LRSDPSPHIGDHARQRLADLVQAANADGPAPVGWAAVGPRPLEPLSWRDSLGCLAGAFAALTVVVVLAVLGLIAVITFFA